MTGLDAGLWGVGVPVVVEWMDAARQLGGEYPAEEVAEAERGGMELTVGFVVFEDADFLCLAWSGGSEYRDRYDIPKALIRRVTLMGPTADYREGWD